MNVVQFTKAAADPLQAFGGATTIANLSRLWALLLFAPCVCLGHFSRRLPVLQSVAVVLAASTIVEKFDYVPFFHRTLISSNVSTVFVRTWLAWIALAAFLGFIGARLKTYTTNKRSKGRK
jgi:hypothetical protein